MSKATVTITARERLVFEPGEIIATFYGKPDWVQVKTNGAETSVEPEVPLSIRRIMERCKANTPP